MKILLGTTNPGKLKEYRRLFKDLNITLLTPADIPVVKDLTVKETGKSIFENAVLKARCYAHTSGFHSLADDTGLFVDVLDGLPGVESKRFGKDDTHRNRKILALLKDIPWKQRGARFVTTIALAHPEQYKVITRSGWISGRIALEPMGEHGFGYDPIFYVPELDRTFAQLSRDQKNRYSHRSRAAQKIKKVLNSLEY